MRNTLYLYNWAYVFIYQRTMLKSIQIKAFGLDILVPKHEKKIRCKRKVYYFILHRE